MGWQCKMVDADKFPKEVGDMWFGEVWTTDDPHVFYCAAGRLSDQYINERRNVRPPVLVMMPSRDVFSVDAVITGKSTGWAVTGEPPNLTVSPSINLIGRYHGYLRSGVLSDDVEGRQYS